LLVIQGDLEKVCFVNLEHAMEIQEPQRNLSVVLPNF